MVAAWGVPAESVSIGPPQTERTETPRAVVTWSSASGEPVFASVTDWTVEGLEVIYIGTGLTGDTLIGERAKVHIGEELVTEIGNTQLEMYGIQLDGFRMDSDWGDDGTELLVVSVQMSASFTVCS